MVDAPDRIWAWRHIGEQNSGAWRSYAVSWCDAEYIRADRIAQLERELAEARKLHEDHLVRLSQNLGNLSRYINEQGDYRSLEDWEAFLLDRTKQLLHKEDDERRRAEAAEAELAEARAELDTVKLERDANHNLAVANGERAKEEDQRATAAEAKRDRLAADNAQLREALTPFAGDKLPTAKRTKIDYNRWGLRCAISPLELARDRARASLQTGEKQG